MTAIDMVKITVNLVIIYVIGGLVMAFVYSKTSPILYKKIQEEKEAALKVMMPEADEIKEIGEWRPHEKHASYYVARKCSEIKIKTVKDEKGNEKQVKECIGPEDIGYIVECFGKGYSSYIHILASVDKNFVVKKINILGHAETPGLGDEIEKDYFLKQFEGKGVEKLVVVKGETPDKIQAITGATISSRAVTEDGVRKGVEMLISRFSKEVKKG